MTAHLTDEERKSSALHDLQFLANHSRLGEWGMEALRDTLVILFPDMQLSTIRE